MNEIRRPVKDINTNVGPDSSHLCVLFWVEIKSQWNLRPKETFKRMINETQEYIDEIRKKGPK